MACLDDISVFSDIFNLRSPALERSELRSVPSHDDLIASKRLFSATALISRADCWTLVVSAGFGGHKCKLPVSWCRKKEPRDRFPPGRRRSCRLGAAWPRWTRGILSLLFYQVIRGEERLKTWLAKYVTHPYAIKTHLGALSCVFMAWESWRSNTMISTNGVSLPMRVSHSLSH